MVNLHIFLKLYLSRICNAMAIGKDLILLHHDDLNFYTTLSTFDPIKILICGP